MNGSMYFYTSIGSGVVVGLTVSLVSTHLFFNKVENLRAFNIVDNILKDSPVVDILFKIKDGVGVDDATFNDILILLKGLEKRNIYFKHSLFKNRFSFRNLLYREFLNNIRETVVSSKNGNIDVASRLADKSLFYYELLRDWDGKSRRIYLSDLESRVDKETCFQKVKRFFYIKISPYFW